MTEKITFARPSNGTLEVRLIATANELVNDLSREIAEAILQHKAGAELGADEKKKEAAKSP